MDILKKINWKQPKYMIPLIIYFPLLFVGYFVIDLFYTEKAEVPNNSLTSTEYLNPILPDAKMKGDGIGNKYESMLKSYGKIDDYSAIDNIDRIVEIMKTSKSIPEAKERLMAEEFEVKFNDEFAALIGGENTRHLSDAQAQAIVENVVEKVKAAKEAGNQVIFTMDTHEANYLETSEGKNLRRKQLVLCLR